MTRLTPGLTWLLICAGTVALLAVWALLDAAADRIVRRWRG